MDTAEMVGTVIALWRYPVKSMGGAALTRAALTARGILGDRAYAVRDRDTGHIASAKHPRKWSALLACSAEFLAPPVPGAPLPPVRITLPDGASVTSADPDVDRVLSRALGRTVTLVAQAPAQPTREANRTPIDAEDAAELILEEPLALAAPDGTFFDHAPLHLLTTATLEHFGELYPGGAFAPRRFRPNLLIAPPPGAEGFVETAWIGRELCVGTVRLRIIDPTPRCVVTTLAQGQLPHDPNILRTVHRHGAAASATVAPGVLLPTVAGVYGSILAGGSVGVGEQVRLG